MKFKEGVKFDGVRGPILKALWLAEPVMEKYGDFVVTSLLDGKHSEKSLHYAGLAADLRTRHMKPNEITEAADKLRESLGKNYDVVVESDHIHMEYDPKV